MVSDIVLVLSVLLFIFSNTLFALGQSDNGDRLNDLIELPDPRYNSDISVEEALLQRRSIRQYSESSISLNDLSQVLWAAQGITNERGYRTAPSAGALYPIELYVVIGSVEEISAGVYKYNPHENSLEQITAGDKRNDLFKAALWQEPVENAQVVLVFTVVYERTMVKYGERGIRYAQIEIGHAAQNVYLQCVSLNLGTVFIGAFNDDSVKSVINAEENEEPLGIMPVGLR